LQAAQELKLVKQLLKEMSHFLQTPPTDTEATHKIKLSSIW
jgi:hypothetical protein